jgi:hypothetical protein
MVLPNAKMALMEAVVRIKTLKEANCPVWKGIWKRCGECSEIAVYSGLSPTLKLSIYDF